MITAKQLGFLFGYMEKAAIAPRGFRPKGLPPRRRPAPKPAAKPAVKSEAVEPKPKIAPSKGMAPVRREPPRQAPAGQQSKPQIAGPVPVTPAATPEARLGVAQPVTPGAASPQAQIEAAKAVSAPASEVNYVPWENRLSPWLGVSPKALNQVASIGGGLALGQAVKSSLRSPEEEALQAYLLANPFNYNQLNPYAASLMV